MPAPLTIPLGPTSVRDVWRGPAWLASGHRPFFLATGIYGALALGMWMFAWFGLLPLTSSWHGHEMVFGFGVAAIAGFLQAAVPKWTQQPTYRGARAALLFALWLPGLHLLDLLVLPVLAFHIGRDLYRARNRRNYIVAGVLLALWGVDLLYHFGPPSLALRVAVYLVTALIALIGGRIVPVFTRNAMRLAGEADFDCRTPRWLEIAAVPAVLGVGRLASLADAPPAARVDPPCRLRVPAARVRAQGHRGRRGSGRAVRRPARPDRGRYRGHDPGRRLARGVGPQRSAVAAEPRHRPRLRPGHRRSTAARPGVAAPCAPGRGRALVAGFRGVRQGVLADPDPAARRRAAGLDHGSDGRTAAHGPWLPG
jgi:hypothetical protein